MEALRTADLEIGATIGYGATLWLVWGEVVGLRHLLDPIQMLLDDLRAVARRVGDNRR